MVDTYDSLVQEFKEYFSENPNACVSLGLDIRLNDLPDPSLKAEQESVEKGEKLLARMSQLPAEGLNFNEKIDLDLAMMALESDIFASRYTFNNRTQSQQMPTAADDISNGIFIMFTNDPRPSNERLDNITARLEKVPEYLDTLISRLDTPVKRWVDIDLESIDGLPEFFDNISNWAKDEGYEGLERLNAAKEKANTHIEAYKKRLKNCPTTNYFAIGDEQERRLVKLRGIDMSFEELHEMTTDFLSRTNKQIEDLRVKLIGKYSLSQETDAEGVQRFLAKEHGLELNDILGRYAEERDRVLGYIKEHSLFPLPADHDMQIMKTPAFMEPTIPAGAMMSPPPFRSGTKISNIYLTLSPELVDEHNGVSIPVMMIHEGIPGHHLQFASAYENPSIVRRFMDSADMYEGWTTMLEDYMLDIGYMGKLTDEARFFAKREICRLGARVAIDLYFMTGKREYLDVGVEIDTSSDDPFVNAGNLLHAVTGFVPGRLKGELNWYSQCRGYPLSYLTGNTLVWQLKQDIQKAQKGKLEGLDLDREFHRVYLGAGCMPVPFLRKIFSEEGLL